MTLLVFLHVVAEFLSFVTHTTMVCNLPDMALHVYCLVIPEAPSEYFTHQESSLPPKCLQRGQNHVEYFWPPSAYSFHQGPGIISFSFMASSTLPGSCWVMLAFLLTIPSTSNHHFLLQGAFNRARIMLDIANLPLTTPSTGNHLFLVYDTKIMLAIAGLSFTIPSIRNCFSLLQHIFNRARVLLGVGRPPSNYSIQH